MTQEWWTSVSNHPGSLKKVTASLLMLLAWEIWDERNARVFRNFSSFLMSVFSHVKGEAALWVKAGTTHHGVVISGE